VELVWHYLRSGLELRAKKTGKDLADLKTGLASSVDRIEKRQGMTFSRRRKQTCADGVHTMKYAGRKRRHP